MKRFLAVLLCVLVFAGCSDSEATPATTTSTAAPSLAIPPDPKRPPPPTDAQVQAISKQLAVIQPEMAEIPAHRVSSWAHSMCLDIWSTDLGNIDLPSRAVYRFSGGDRPVLTPAQGQQIVDAITTIYCHPGIESNP